MVVFGVLVLVCCVVVVGGGFSEVVDVDVGVGAVGAGKRDITDTMLTFKATTDTMAQELPGFGFWFSDG